MIISHKHKFIFIKPQKTAGTSVELLLSRVCGTDDVITPLGYDPDPKVREKNKAKRPQNYFRKKLLKNWELREIYWLLRKRKIPSENYWEHLQADNIKKYVGKDIWDSYLKIAVVRNPWDHAVSMYEWMRKFGYEDVDKMTFNEFVRNIYKLQWPFFSVNGLYSIDFMIRFENLMEDIKALGEKIPDIKGLKMPITKSKVRKETGYKQIYDEGTKEIVRQKNLNIIELFGYSF